MRNDSSAYTGFVKSKLNQVLSFAMFFLLFFLLSCMPCPSQEGVSSSILDQKATLVLRDTNVRNALYSLSIKAKTPIGFIGVAGENGEARRINVKVVQRSIRETLDEIINSDNRYKWEVINGQINVSPASWPDNISDLTIEFLQLSEIEVGKVGAAILDAPKIRSYLETVNKKKTEGLIYSGPPINNAKISVVFSNITIRDALNEILRRGEARFWAIETFGKTDEFVRINLFG